MVKYFVCIVLATALTSTGCERRPGPEGGNRNRAIENTPTGDPSPRHFQPIEEAVFAGPDSCWLVTGYAELLRTEDAGKTWDKTPSETVGGFAHVSFIDSKRGWAINDQGQVWSSNDGGRSWLPICQLTVEEDHLVGGVEQLSFVDEMHGWIVEPFSVWRTNDGGISWERQDVHREFAVSLYAAYFLNSETGWVADAKNNLHRTTNGGTTWEAERTRIKGDDIVALFFVNNRIGWLSRIGKGGPYRTGDGGHTWVRQQIPDNSAGIDCLYFASESEGWAGGASPKASTSDTDEFVATLFNTTDGGTTWRTVLVGETDLGYSHIFFDDSRHGWLVGYDKVYYTDDAGLNWKVILKLERQRSS